MQSNSKRSTSKVALVILLVYVCLIGIYVWVAGENRYIRGVETSMIAPSASIGELVDGMVVTQQVDAQMDRIDRVVIRTGTFGRSNTGLLRIALLRDGEAVAFGEAAVDGLLDGQDVVIGLSEPVPVDKQSGYMLEIASEGSSPGNAITVCYGASVSLGRGDVDLSIAPEEALHVDGVAQPGRLCYAMQGITRVWFGEHFFTFAGIGFMLLCAYLVLQMIADRKNKSTLTLRMLSAYDRYRFLLDQLVLREFKTKYKRSVLGIFWSFLNPLLTMIVQYVVFSTLFRSDIPNFPVYLFCGIICFNFFSESSNSAMMSIVGNASLINKVYMPKYIYPVSRVLSSVINLLLSLLPLLIIMLVTGTPITKAILLLPYGLVCLIIFSMGMGLILATMMVFFRDTAFLWGVLVMLWMYLTPIFYPITIIPAKLLTLYKLNPLYHIIGFVRQVLMYGVTPELSTFLACALSALGVLAVGALIFKRKQDQFILYM